MPRCPGHDEHTMPMRLTHGAVLTAVVTYLVPNQPKV